MTVFETRPLRELRDQSRPISYGIVQPGRPTASGVPIVRVNNFIDNSLDLSNALRVDPKVEAQYQRSRPKVGDVLLTLVGSIGQVAIAPFEIQGWNLARAVGLIPTTDEHHSRWIALALRSPKAQAFIHQHANTTVQATFNLKDLAELPIPYPERKIREGILSVLSPLDDKIELNRRMNETLEAMAQAIFRDWFVDFGPVRRKMAGITDPVAIMGGLTPDPARAAELAALFPDALGQDDLPTGWSASTVGNAFNLTMGQSPPGETYNDTGDGLPFFQGRTDFGFRFPVRRKFCSQPTRIANPDDTLISVRAPVGDLNMAWEKCCIGRGVAAARHKGGGKTYTYYAMRYLQPELKQFESEGTVFGAINKKQFEQLPIVEPGALLISAFEDVAGVLDDRLRVAVSENRTLAETRDYLLPRLMSGEVRVGDVAQELAA